MNNTNLQTYYGRDIEEGSMYYVVYRNNDDIASLICGEQSEGRAQVATRFQTLSGAEKYIKRKPLGERGTSEFSKKVQQPVVVVPPKTKEELFEDEMKALSKLEQLLHVTNRREFELWLRRNNLRMTTNRGDKSTRIYTAGVGDAMNDYISTYYGVQSVRYCCGGAEIGGHAGRCSQELLTATDEQRFVIFKYLAEEFDELIKEQHPNLGLVTYVKRPGNMTDPSGRFGMMLNFSKYFQNVTRFINPNTNNIIDIYVVNEDWPTNM